jgi:hypothetical protein
MIDLADWETGYIEGWVDKDMAEDMGMPWRTLQKQRQQLEEAGYITCCQDFHCINIYINNWTNPRLYPDDKVPQIEYDEPVKQNHGTRHGTHHGTHHPYTKMGTPSYIPHTTDHISHIESAAPKPPRKKRKRDERLDHPAIKAYRSETHLHVPIVWRDEVIQVVGNDNGNVEKWKDLVHEWIGRGWNRANVKGMLDAYREGGIKHHGKRKSVGSIIAELSKELK